MIMYDTANRIFAERRKAVNSVDVLFSKYFLILWPPTMLSVRDTEMLRPLFSGSDSPVGEIKLSDHLKEGIIQSEVSALKESIV